jgi:hypothetical protein
VAAGPRCVGGPRRAGACAAGRSTAASAAGPSSGRMTRAAFRVPPRGRHRGGHVGRPGARTISVQAWTGPVAPLCGRLAPIDAGPPRRDRPDPCAPGVGRGRAVGGDERRCAAWAARLHAGGVTVALRRSALDRRGLQAYHPMGWQGDGRQSTPCGKARSPRRSL